MKIAIAYDWIDKWGGVERMLLSLRKIFPKAPFYTSYYDQENAAWAKEIDIRESFMKRLPKGIKNNRVLSVPFYSFAFETFDFNEYDVVISVSSSFAKGIVTLPKTKHINICLTTTRFLWHHKNSYIKTKWLNPYISYLKKWDYDAGKRPDTIISISKTVQKRVNEIYNRDSDIIYPPFDLDYWNDIKLKIETNTPYFIPHTSYYLLVSRLEPYKNIELVLRLFKQSKHRNLVVIGNGTQFQSLQQYKSLNITFLKHVSDVELASLYAQAEALIMPQIEDFGYVALEAQFFGCPVIAYAQGGATETVIANKTGIFFDDQSLDSLKKALIKYDRMGDSLKKSTTELGVQQCEKFETTIFEKKIKELIGI